MAARGIHRESVVFDIFLFYFKISIMRSLPTLREATMEAQDSQHPDSRIAAKSSYPQLIRPPQNILLGGLQGAGKGTHSSRLLAREGIETYVSSDKMREHPSYPQLKADMEAGVLVPNERVLVIVREFLDTRKQMQDAAPIVFDGMPRTIGQKDDFDAMLQEYDREQAWAVLLQLDVDPKVADDIARASVRFRARRDAPKGKARKDDEDMAVLERRIRGFHNETEPLFERYGEQGRLLVVDAKPTFD